MFLNIILKTRDLIIISDLLEMPCIALKKLPLTQLVNIRKSIISL